MDYITISGLILNTIGSIFLAYSLNRTTKMLDTSVTALEHFKDTLLSKGDVLSFTGLNKHRKNALSNTKKLTTIGLSCLIFGFLLQLVSLIINKISP